MGKKRRALSSPQKFKARYRTLRGNASTDTATTTENSVVAAQLAEEQAAQVTETPVQEIIPEIVETTTPTETEVPTLEASQDITTTVKKAPSRTRSRKTTPRSTKTSATKSTTTRSRRTKTKITDSTEAE